MHEVTGLHSVKAGVQTQNFRKTYVAHGPSRCVPEERARTSKVAQARVSCAHFIDISGSTARLIAFTSTTFNAPKKK